MFFIYFCLLILFYVVFLFWTTSSDQRSCSWHCPQKSFLELLRVQYQMLELNLGWTCAKQVSYPMFYHSSPKFSIFTIFDNRFFVSFWLTFSWALSYPCHQFFDLIEHAHHGISNYIVWEFINVVHFFGDFFNNWEWWASMCLTTGFLIFFLY